MKIALTSKGKTLDDQIDPRFGRAAWFIVYDTETNESSVLPNEQNVTAAQGAGIQAAQTIASSGATVLVTGNCGPKAFTALQAADVSVFSGVAATCKEAIESLRRGDMSPAEGASVEGHW
ncbi:MAG: dinitrogenase iron-molybdenum cofactor biosynthesis protein [Chitinivibrionales bacterium]|nr:dinitrogenase iron-molybdenum cofactor biosynthesis protein [Chitinivibrionales bacterium]